MRLEISHVTRYRYDRSVHLSPHTVKLQPRCDGAQVLESFELTIDPLPTRKTTALDLDGNVATQMVFEQAIESLEVKVHSTVRTLRTNPFDFVVTDNDLPMMGYRADWSPIFEPYRAAARIPASTAAFAKEVARESSGEAVAFLSNLAKRIAGDIAQVVRATGAPFPSDVTLAERRGACRDTAVLYLDCCRAQGLAARFVSGYQETPDRSGAHALHAWVEVCLPGAGWRGFDPSLGIAVADRHVAVAAAYAPLGASPISGSYYGGRAGAQMETEIAVARLEK